MRFDSLLCHAIQRSHLSGELTAFETKIASIVVEAEDDVFVIKWTDKFIAQLYSLNQTMSVGELVVPVEYRVSLPPWVLELDTDWAP